MQFEPGGALANAGTLDCTNSAAVLDVIGSSIFDLSQGAVLNTTSAALTIGPDSLLIVPAGSIPRRSLPRTAMRAWFTPAGAALNVPVTGRALPGPGRSATS